MSFFKNVFGSSNQENQLPIIEWNQLKDISQLNEIAVSSTTKPILIFKHSRTCIISRMALKNFEREFDLQEEITPYFLDLLNHRDVSNAIASKFEVVHQSPQILLIKNGKSIYNDSHESISVESVKKYI